MVSSNLRRARLAATVAVAVALGVYLGGPAVFAAEQSVGHGADVPRHEVERVVARVLAASPPDARTAAVTPRDLLNMFVRCVEVRPGYTYCLHLGWDLGQDGPQHRAALLDRAAQGAEPARSGAADLLTSVRRFAAQPETARRAWEANEIRHAFATLGKVTAARDWGARTTGTSRQMAAAPAEGFTIPMSMYHEQETNYWCGASATQMIGQFGYYTAQQYQWWYVIDDGSGDTNSYKIRDALNGYTSRWSHLSPPFSILTYPSHHNTLKIAITHDISSHTQPMSISVRAGNMATWLKGNYAQHFWVVTGYQHSGDWIQIMEPLNEQRFGYNDHFTGGYQYLWVDRLHTAMGQNTGNLVW